MVEKQLVYPQAPRRLVTDINNYVGDIILIHTSDRDHFHMTFENETYGNGAYYLGFSSLPHQTKPDQ
jgi:hypothetical protein